MNKRNAPPTESEGTKEGAPIDTRWVILAALAATLGGFVFLVASGALGSAAVSAAAELIRSIAWPATVLSIAFYFRARISELIPRIRTMKGPGGVELELRDVAAATDDLEATIRAALSGASGPFKGDATVSKSTLDIANLERLLKVAASLGATRARAGLPPDAVDVRLDEGKATIIVASDEQVGRRSGGALDKESELEDARRRVEALQREFERADSRNSVRVNFAYAELMKAKERLVALERMSTY